MAIRFIESGTRVCAYVRCELPARALKKIGVNSIRSTDLHYDYITGIPTTTDRCPVYVFQIPHGRAEQVMIVKKLKEAGKTVVAEWDDDYINVPPTSPQFRVDKYFRDNIVSRIGVTKLADVVTVSTPELAAIYRRINKNVVVLPNCIDMADWPKPRKKGRRLRIGFASGVEMNNFRIVSSALERIVEEYDYVDIYIGGSKLSYDMLNVPDKRKVFIPYVPVESFPDMLRQFDIGVVPLEDNRFNAGKSELRGLQHGALKIPILASSVPPYRRFAKEAGSDEFLVKKPQHWLRSLRNLIESPALQDELGEKAHQQALRMQIDNHIHKWVDAYADAMGGD